MNHQKLFNEGENRRKEDRRREHRHIWVDPGGTFLVVDCKVIDISKGGARIAPPQDVELPNTITMQFDASDLRRRAHVVWRNGHEIGLIFADQQEASIGETAVQARLERLREAPTALRSRSGNSSAEMVATTRKALQARVKNFESSHTAAAGLAGRISQGIVKLRARLDSGANRSVRRIAENSPPARPAGWDG